MFLWVNLCYDIDRLRWDRLDSNLSTLLFVCCRTKCRWFRTTICEKNCSCGTCKFSHRCDNVEVTFSNFTNPFLCTIIVFIFLIVRPRTNMWTQFKRVRWVQYNKKSRVFDIGMSDRRVLVRTSLGRSSWAFRFPKIEESKSSGYWRMPSAILRFWVMVFWDKKLSWRLFLALKTFS